MPNFYLVAALAVAAATPADSGETTPKATGLPGTTWAMDCKQPPSDSNTYADYSVSNDGRLVETLRSSELPQARKLRNIQLISKNWLLYTLDDTDGDAVNILTYIDERGRMRSWWSVGNGGKAYVLNGKVVGETSSLPWFTRCE